jgi:hypothetical protein
MEPKSIDSIGPIVIHEYEIYAHAYQVTRDTSEDKIDIVECLLYIESSTSADFAKSSHNALHSVAYEDYSLLTALRVFTDHCINIIIVPRLLKDEN